MRRFRRTMFMALAMVVLAAGTDVVTASEPVIVNVNSNFFDPADLTVPPGTTVRWHWVSGLHTTTSNDCLWDSGLQTPCFDFDYTFNDTGDFGYVCSVHVCCGMTGTVHVNSCCPPPANPGFMSARVGLALLGCIGGLGVAAFPLRRYLRGR